MTVLVFYTLTEICSQKYNNKYTENTHLYAIINNVNFNNLQNNIPSPNILRKKPSSHSSVFSFLFYAEVKSIDYTRKVFCKNGNFSLQKTFSCLICCVTD